jgi:hypothetical protein
VTPLLAVAASCAALGVGAPVPLAHLPWLERSPLLPAWLWLAAALGALAVPGCYRRCLPIKGDRALSCGCVGNEHAHEASRHHAPVLQLQTGWAAFARSEGQSESVIAAGRAAP